MSKIVYTDAARVDADTTRMIEAGTTTERTAARMLKATTPILKEIVFSGELAQVAGFVRGVGQIIGSVVISLPPAMREGIGNAIRSEVEHALEIARKGPPK